MKGRVKPTGGTPESGEAAAKPEGRAGRGRPPSAEGPKGNVLSIRGSTEWRDWLNELSDHCRLKAADVIDRALIDYAKKEGFTRPAPKR